MKRHLAIAVTFALALPLPTSTIAQTLQVNRDNRTIAVTATDKVIVMADVATVHVGFIAYGPDSDSAYATGSRVSNNIVEALEKAGASPDAIESEAQNVSPVQEYQIDKLSPSEKAMRKFQVTQSWSVRSKPDDAARLLDAAVKAGANQSGAIDWSLADENRPQAEAAAKALQRARAVASQMAAGLSVKLGPLVFASNEVESAPPRPLMKAAVPMAAMAAPVQPLAINPRRIEKTATVYAVFSIE
jgi:uncharacterized protein YggE